MPSKQAPEKPPAKRRRAPPGRAVEKVETTYRTTTDIADVVSKIKSEVEKGAVKLYTPYSLAQAMNIKISDAKKALREAARLGILKLYSGGRRSPIYVPVEKAK